MPPLASMSVVHWARNALVMVMRKNADYCLFVDCDMGLEPDTLDRLMSHGKDLVAALCTRRTDPAIPNIRAWIEQEQNFGELVTWDEEKSLIPVDAVGTGVILISRRVLEDVAEAYHPEQYHKTGNGFWFENIRFPHLDAEAGEDISFVLKATRLGYECFVDTTIQPFHYDAYGYSYKDYIPHKAERIADIIKRMEKEATELGLKERPEQLKSMDRMLAQCVEQVEGSLKSGELVIA